MNEYGHYIRASEGDSAELHIRKSAFTPDTVHVEGMALFGENREFGPNLGNLDFVSQIYDEQIVYSDRDYTIRIKLLQNGIEVTEENVFGYFGMGVSFSGKYYLTPRSNSIFVAAANSLSKLVMSISDMAKRLR